MQAQQWSCFAGSEVMYYINWAGEYHAIMATDSAVTPNQVTYNLYRTIEYDPYCNAGSDGETRNPKKPIWAGYSINKLDNGDNVFFNLNGESITISTAANVGDSWIFYTDSLSVSLIATVISNDTATLFNTYLDSVKTIRLTLFAPVSSMLQYWDSTEIKLSATYGLLTAPFFLSFPNERRLLKRTIRAPLTYKDMYSYNVGDYFQICYVRNGYPPGPFSARHYEYVKVIRKTYLFGGSSVQFFMHRERQSVNNGFVSGISIDTIVLRYDDLNKFVGTGIPQEFKFFREYRDYLADNTGNNLYSKRISQVIEHLEFRQISDSCLDRSMYADFERTTKSYECLGTLESTFSIGGDSDAYVTYANLCGSSYGTKVVLSPSPPVGSNEQIQQTIVVYPNPTTDFILMENPSSLLFEVVSINAQGQTIRHSQLTPNSNIQIDLSSYPVGVYIFQFRSEALTFCRKIVKTQ
jgi:hypothetical protein